MHEIIKSVGIDIGTSTTQLIFSELTIENEASNYVVPRINIVDKKVTYRSKIYFTPLLDQKTIDAEKVKEIIEKEYQDAGMKPEDLSTGAVIITGETARKQNTNELMATHFSDVMWLIEQIMWKSLDKRVASFLLEETSIEGTNELKITHETIANHLGSHREVITRMLRYFQSEGLVQLSRGKIAILDSERLKTLQGS